jgi:replicative DNA helicase
MRAFKDLAVEFGIIMIVVGQPRKPKDDHFGRELQMRGIKGSESLASDASQVFILHRKRLSDEGDDTAVFAPETKVILDKSRESEGRVTKLLFRGEICKFVEMVGGGMEE